LSCDNFGKEKEKKRKRKGKEKEMKKGSEKRK